MADDDPRSNDDRDESANTDTDRDRSAEIDTDPDRSAKIDTDRDAILKRRNRFIALALSGLSSAAVAGCYESHTPAGLVPDSSVVDAGRDASSPEPCLGAPLPEDAGDPIPPDAGEPFDGGPDGATPGPCLTAPKPGDAGTD